MKSGPVSDGFKPAKSSPLASEHLLLTKLLSGYDGFCLPSFSDLNVEKTSSGKTVLSLDRDEQSRCVAALVERLALLEDRITTFRKRHGFDANIHNEKGWDELRNPHSIFIEMLRILLKRTLPLSEATLLALVEWLCSVHGLYLHWYPLPGPIQNLESFFAKGEPSRQMVEASQALLQKIETDIGQKEGHKFIARLRDLVGASPNLPVEAGEAWSDAALADFKSMSKASVALWKELLEHCNSASGSAPSNSWRRKAEELLGELGWTNFKKPLLRWFPLIDLPRTKVLTEWYEGLEPDPNGLIIAPHAHLLRGLVWFCGLREDREFARAISALALSAYRKVPMKGPREVKVGNACVTALGMMPGLDAVGQLALLKVRIKFGTAQKMIEKAFDAAAARAGLPREEIEEMAVPTYGLTDVGICEEAMGEFTARLAVTGTDSTELVWLKADGKPQKSVPASVKASHAEELKELQAAAKDIQRMLPAQRERIDALFLQQKSWPMTVWRERYLDHPLVGVLARRLIWEFTTGDRTTAGMFSASSRRRESAHSSDGGKNQRGLTSTATDLGVEDLDLRPVPSDDTTVVRLWHPIGKDVDEVLAWRGWLETRQIQQPFKQAHREVYLLTDAERRTGTYSNRYAAHVLKQHQFNALCAARGWKNKLRLMVDDTYPPATRHLPQWNLRAEFWVEGAGSDYRTDANESGTYLHLTTDQVRFYLPNAAQLHAQSGSGTYAPAYGQTADEPIPLEQVPPLVFSEIMRDVDLFVGVASVGNDPTWNDGGPGGQHRDYWQHYAFGDLGVSAANRKEILERLVPRLKIAKQCSFADKFLVVRGSVRTYKIHLGSGNILMEPNDQYLCIVPKQGAVEKEPVFLPFEGDRTLSLILSKAFLLADDGKVKDETILTQIRK